MFVDCSSFELEPSLHHPLTARSLCPYRPLRHRLSLKITDDNRQHTTFAMTRTLLATVTTYPEDATAILLGCGIVIFTDRTLVPFSDGFLFYSITYVYAR
jgi:hypothetical protein